MKPSRWTKIFLLSLVLLSCAGAAFAQTAPSAASASSSPKRVFLLPSHTVNLNQATPWSDPDSQFADRWVQAGKVVFPPESELQPAAAVEEMKSKGWKGGFSQEPDKDVIAAQAKLLGLSAVMICEVRGGAAKGNRGVRCYLIDASRGTMVSRNGDTGLAKLAPMQRDALSGLLDVYLTQP